MVSNGEQTIRIGWQINPDHLRLFVNDMIDEARVLVRKTIMVLPPDVRGEQIIERRNGTAPWDVIANLQPLGVLVEHGINDVNERFIAGEEAMAAGEQISLEPALALVLT